MSLQVTWAIFTSMRHYTVRFVASHLLRVFSMPIVFKCWFSKKRCKCWIRQYSGIQNKLFDVCFFDLNLSSWKLFLLVFILFSFCVSSISFIFANLSFFWTIFQSHILFRIKAYAIRHLWLFVFFTLFLFRYFFLFIDFILFFLVMKDIFFFMKVVLLLSLKILMF